MKLELVWTPTGNIKESARFYRDVLGWEEAWREGETTMAFRMPGTEIQLMVDTDSSGLKPGPFFRVDSVDAFYQEHKDTLRFAVPPKDIPPGRYACFLDPAGNSLHVYDTTRER